MSGAIKNGSLDFGDLKSGNGSSAFNASPGFQSESDKAKVSSPRSPVGRTDKRTSAKESLIANAADDKKKAISPVIKKPIPKEVPKENVGQFYYPKGKPIPKETTNATELAI